MRYKGGGVGHLWTLPPSRSNRWLPQLVQGSATHDHSSQSQNEQEQHENVLAAGQSYEMDDDIDEQDISDEEEDLEENGDEFLDDLEFDAEELDEFLDDIL